MTLINENGVHPITNIEVLFERKNEKIIIF